MKNFCHILYKAYCRHPLRAAILATVISYWGYEWLFNAKIAFGIVCLLLVHELGHFLVARFSGVKIGVPMLVPFLGAVIDVKDTSVDAGRAARIALGGPLLGAAGAVGFAILYSWLLDVNWLILAYIGAMLNLFNLIPAEPLDGGRAAFYISPGLWWIGLLIIGVLAVITMSLFIWLIFLFSIIRFWGLNKSTDWPDTAAEHGEKIKLFILYLWLILVLGLLMAWLAELLKRFSY